MRRITRFKNAAVVAGLVVPIAMGCGGGDNDKAPPDHGGDPTAHEDTNATCDASDPTVESGHGPVCGTLTHGQYPGAGEPQKPVYAYKGIRYAQSTADKKRWTFPVPPAKWTEAKPAKEYGDVCFQVTMAASDNELNGVEEPVFVPDDENTAINTIGSEDCLFLNVWTPEKPKSTASKPVIVFIHGGAFLSGSGGSEKSNLYNGSNLAATGDVVVVTLNYRLGVFGFFGNFGGADTPTKLGNQGLRDQQLAMKWVSENIANFGGDPKKVTLMGESAGASSVSAHLMNPTSETYFAQAIQQSNHYGMLYTTPQWAHKRADGLSKLTRSGKVGTRKCHKAGGEDEQVACLQKVDAHLIAVNASENQALAYDPGPHLGPVMKCQGAGGFEYWGPMVDGTFVPHQPVDQTVTKPMLIGTNLNEGTYFAVMMKGAFANFLLTPNLTSLENWKKAMTKYLFFTESKVDAVNLDKPDGYGPIPVSGDYDKYEPYLSTIMTDYLFNCGEQKVLAKATGTPKFVYSFQHPPSGNIYSGGSADACAGSTGQVCHGEELPYVFGNPAGEAAFRADELGFVKEMMSYWTNFAACGNPNGDTDCGVEIEWVWPSYEAGEAYILKPLLLGGISGGTVNIAEESKCATLWLDKVGYAWNPAGECN